MKLEPNAGNVDERSGGDDSEGPREPKDGPPLVGPFVPTPVPNGGGEEDVAAGVVGVD